MLNENERERIRLEETYRAEVRNKLAEEAPKPKKSPILAFLNSSLGLWLLSAVFITGAGALFTQYEHARAEDAKRRETIERLDLEISYRYSRVLGDLFRLTTRDVNDPVLAPGRTAEDVRQVMSSLNQQPAGGSGALYAEFANLSLPALLAELRRHLTNPKEREEVDAALASLTGEVWSNTDYSSVKGVAAVIQHLLMKPRWRQGYFHFIDCPVEQPFC